MCFTRTLSSRVGSLFCLFIQAMINESKIRTECSPTVNAVARGDCV